jgi:hypothetical protein
VPEKSKRKFRAKKISVRKFPGKKSAGKNFELSFFLKKKCYSCGWMITFKLPSRCRAVKRKPSTVSFKGKTWVIISVTLILLC